MERSASQTIETELDVLLTRFSGAFASKKFVDAEATSDLLMDVFSITPLMKAKNHQFWGRQLGTLWETMLGRLFADRDPSTRFPEPGTHAEPCDIISGALAVDAKYRVGSGDSGTLQKLAENARRLQANGFDPVMLVFRHDSLRSSISAAKRGGWTVYQGDKTLDFVHERLAFDIRGYLRNQCQSAIPGGS